MPGRPNFSIGPIVPRAPSGRTASSTTSSPRTPTRLDRGVARVRRPGRRRGRSARRARAGGHARAGLIEEGRPPAGVGAAHRALPGARRRRARLSGRSGVHNYLQLVNVPRACGSASLRAPPSSSRFSAQAGENALQVSRLVERRFREHPNSGITQEQVKAEETEGDAITRELITLLNTQYVTPFDRDDIYHARDRDRRRRRLPRGGLRPARPLRRRDADAPRRRAVRRSSSRPRAARDRVRQPEGHARASRRRSSS